MSTQRTRVLDRGEEDSTTSASPWSGPVLGGLLTLVLMALTLAFSVFFSLPSNVLSVRDGGPMRVLWAHALPQGWAFFTKPPSDPELVAYRLEDDGELSYAALTPNSLPRNMFGLTRKQRAQGPEIAAMANQTRDWNRCGVSDGDCLSDVAHDEDGPSIINTAPSPTLCGPVVIVETEPVPWAYRHNYDGWRLDSRYTSFEAVCR